MIVVLRPYHSEADIPLIVSLINTTRRADGNEHLVTVGKVANVFRTTPGFDPRLDVVLIELDGRPIGSSRVWWGQDADGTRRYFSLAAILPEWRGQGIGARVLRHNQERLRQIAGATPGDAPCFFETWATDLEAHHQRLLLRDGYQPVTYAAQMLRADLEDIPSVPLPPGLEVRPVQPGHMRAIWEADHEAFADHWGFVDDGEDGYRAFLDNPLADPSLWCVAWAGAQVAGQVRSYINPAENAELSRLLGYTEDISVRRPWRRLGLARALAALSLAALKSRGMQQAALMVHLENSNGALALYESLGFRVTRRFTVFRKPLS